MTARSDADELARELRAKVAALESENSTLKTEAQHLQSSIEIRDRLAKKVYMKAKEEIQILKRNNKCGPHSTFISGFFRRDKLRIYWPYRG